MTMASEGAPWPVVANIATKVATDLETAAVEVPVVTQRRVHIPVLAVENTRTSDGRLFQATTWRRLPVALMWQEKNLGGHEGAIQVGRIDTIVRDGHTLEAWGVLDASVFADAANVVAILEAGMPLGISIDAAARGDILRDPETGDETFESVEILGATLLPFPAFAEAHNTVELTDVVPAEAAIVASAPEPSPFRGIGLVASATQTGTVPRAWFERAAMTRREGLHIEADGQIWGHLAGWGECHTGSPVGECTMAPRSRHDYAYFLTGRVLCDDGTEVASGPIVLHADHGATRGLSWLRAKDHYANTALAAADVTVGEDDYGIWIAGGIRPGTPSELVHAVRGSAPSGDWRPIGTGMELVAILSVNTPGFPALVASIGDDGQLESLFISSSLSASADCGCGGHGALDAALERLARVEAHVNLVEGRARREALDEIDAHMGYDRAALVAALDVEMV